MATQLYRICWKSKLTSASGHGDPLEKSIAEAWLQHDALKDPDTIEHWLEPVTAEPPAAI